MFAVIKDNKITGVYTQEPPLKDGETLLPCRSVISAYDKRFQVAIAPASYATAPNKYTLYSDRVERNFLIENIPLVNLKTARCEEVNTLWKEKEQEGFSFGEHLFDSDRDAVIRIIGAVNSTDAPAKWKTKDNQYIDVNKDFLQGMLNALSIYATSLFTQANIHKAAIQELATALAIVEYDISTGW
jgi:hypothetical protein